MVTETAYPHIEKPANHSARLKRLPRIRVAMIVSNYLAHGYSPDEMCRHFPDLTPAEAHMAMAYYFDHKDEIDTEIATELEKDDRLAGQAKSDLVLRLLAIRAKSHQP